MGSGSFAEVAVFVKEQQMMLLEQQREARAEQKQEMARLEARLREEMEQQRAHPEPQPVTPAVTPAALEALQARIEELHVAKLLSDDELHRLENLIADYVEVQATIVDQVVTEATLFSSTGLGIYGFARQVYILITMSAAIKGDAAFARQVRRKFLEQE